MSTAAVTKSTRMVDTNENSARGNHRLPDEQPQQLLMRPRRGSFDRKASSPADSSTPLTPTHRGLFSQFFSSPNFSGQGNGPSNRRPSSPRPPMSQGHLALQRSWDAATSDDVPLHQSNQPRLLPRSSRLTPRYRPLTPTHIGCVALTPLATPGASDRSVASEAGPSSHHHPSFHGPRHTLSHDSHAADRSVVSESFLSEQPKVKAIDLPSLVSTEPLFENDQPKIQPVDLPFHVTTEKVTENNSTGLPADMDSDCSSIGGGGRGDASSCLSHRTDPERRREIRRMAQNRMATIKRQQQSHLPSQPQQISRVPSGIDLSPVEPRKSPVMVMDDDVSSLGGVEDQSSAVLRMTLAIRNNSARPSSLTREERALWDVIQVAIRKATKQPQQSDALSASSLTTGTNSKSSNDNSDVDKTKSVRAIQRVLADVTTERDRALEEVKRLKATLQECSDQQHDFANKAAKVPNLELELRHSKEETQKFQQNQVAYSNELVMLRKERDRFATDLNGCRQDLAKLSRSIVQSNDSTNDCHVLQKDLAEKTASLENAKMIIASLESANGSIAADMRAKLKAKEDEVMFLKKNAADRQKKLDSLATQLRDLQRTHTHTNRHKRKHDERRRLAISSRLEKNMAEMRAASVILEATNDASAVDKMSDILSDSIVALKEGIDLVDDDSCNGDMDSIASYNDTASHSSRNSMPVDVMRLRRELDERTKTNVRLEDALRKQKDETSKLRNEMERQRKDVIESMRQEVQILRDQCKTNMEVLTRKERELATLRDSLKVDDGVGYISDDGTDASDAEEQGCLPSSTHLSLPQYGQSQAEALASLLSHGRGQKTEAVVLCSSSQDEIEILKRDLRQARLESERSRKQLKTEKESLANAKMIISSLEKANKSMMEDLRSRLQDSNTAIASLLEKSMESEKGTNKLRAELEALRREKEAERERFEHELRKRGISGSLSPDNYEEKKEETFQHSIETID